MLTKENTTVTSTSPRTGDRSSIATRRRRWLVVTLAWALLFSALGASPALAAFRIERFDGGAFNPDGSSNSQAGGHADLSTTLNFGTTLDNQGLAMPDGSLKDVRVDLPPGIVGNPNATPKCTAADLAAGFFPTCPDTAAVGVVTVFFASGGTWTSAVYNMVAPANVPAQFGFNVSNVIVHLNASVRTGGDYGLAVDIRNVSQTLPLVATRLTLWGVPADSSHDGERGACAPFGGTCPSSAPRAPFLSNPTDCTTGPLTTTVRADSWQAPGVFETASFVSHLNDGRPQGPGRCDRLTFAGRVTVQSDVPKAGQPSGFSVDLTIPQDDNPTGLATPSLKRAVVTLPEGVAVSPSAADGLRACSSHEIGLDSPLDPQCPNASKIGQVTIDTPVLERPLTGSVYLASQGDNPFNSLLAIYIVARGSGVLVKLPGHVTANDQTGLLTTVFDDNPKLPFTSLRLHFDGGPRAPLANKVTCGPATTTAELTPYSGGPPSVSTSTYSTSFDGGGAPCAPRAFAPAFAAGVTNAAGGRDSTLSVTFSRGDQDNELGAIDLSLPKGLLGRIASTDLCSDAAATQGSCAESSRIGSTTTSVGPGPSPFSLPGRVYITDPYKGAPFGLSIVVPAIAGPFDLGTVVVRAAIFVDRQTAELRIVSDPLPTILQGIPLRIRMVNVHVDREGFMVNPTNCAASRIAAQLSSTAGNVANVASRFQVGDCASLPFKPKMTLRVGARGRTGRDASTPLSVTLEMTNGQSNNRSVQVTLPITMNARLPVVRRACTESVLQAGGCAGARIGSGVAVTPLLRDPLRGSAYFVRSPARRLPDIVVQLRGQVSFDLRGKVTIVHNQLLRTTFDTVPDVPITKFRLDLVAGTNGPVGVVTNLCSARARRIPAQVAFRAQSGKLVQRSQRMVIVGCSRSPRRRAARR